MSYNTPILFLIFNRYDETVKVFQEIKKMKPLELYIAADGPRLLVNGEKYICERIKSYILESIDWNCIIKTRFLSENEGCKMAVSGAIKWFFEQVEEGLIIEDDCIPNESFFFYCEEMLKKYRYDSKILAINGCNFGLKLHDSNYFQSRYINVWGWATWRRSSNLVDYSMLSWSKTKRPLFFIWKSLRRNIFDFDLFWYKYWKENFDRVTNNQLDTWDYQWQYTAMVNKMLIIVAGDNMIKNIGFGVNATHTTDKNTAISDLRQRDFPPPYIYNSSKNIIKIYDDNYVKIKWHSIVPRNLKFYLMNYINVHFIQNLFGSKK